jgi:hypothetical protein
MQLGATNYLQDVRVSIHADSISLKRLFAEIEKQTEIKFSYRNENIAGITVNKVSSLYLRDLPLQVIYFFIP